MRSRSVFSRWSLRSHSSYKWNFTLQTNLCFYRQPSPTDHENEAIEGPLPLDGHNNLLLRFDAYTSCFFLKNSAAIRQYLDKYRMNKVSGNQKRRLNQSKRFLYSLHRRAHANQPPITPSKIKEGKRIHPASPASSSAHAFANGHGMSLYCVLTLLSKSRLLLSLSRCSCRWQHALQSRPMAGFYQ